MMVASVGVFFIPKLSSDEQYFIFFISAAVCGILLVFGMRHVVYMAEGVLHYSCGMPTIGKCTTGKIDIRDITEIKTFEISSETGGADSRTQYAYRHFIRTRKGIVEMPFHHPIGTAKFTEHLRGINAGIMLYRVSCTDDDVEDKIADYLHADNSAQPQG